MGTTKKLVFDESIYQISDVFRALGNPARLQILKILLEKKSASCSIFVKELPLAQSTISKHLLELKKVNLVAIKIDGKKIIYSLISENINFVSEFLSDQIKESKKDFLELSVQKTSIKTTSKTSKRKANPLLKKENYQFSHLTLSKNNK